MCIMCTFTHTGIVGNCKALLCEHSDNVNQVCMYLPSHNDVHIKMHSDGVYMYSHCPKSAMFLISYYNAQRTAISRLYLCAY